MEIQLHIDVAVDGCTLAFRGSRPAMALREYFNQRRNSIEELHPTATWSLDYSSTNHMHYEVLETSLHFLLARISHRFVSCVMEYGPIASHQMKMAILGAFCSEKWCHLMPQTGHGNTDTMILA
jgi:hypothetical protein